MMETDPTANLAASSMARDPWLGLSTPRHVQHHKDDPLDWEFGLEAEHSLSAHGEFILNSPILHSHEVTPTV